MTKIVLLTEFYPPDFGGIQSTLGPIVDGLSGSITVVAPQVQPSDTAIRRSLFSGTSWPRWWWLVRWLRQARRDGMQIAVFGHFSSAVLAAWISGVPYVVLTHGNDILFERRRVLLRALIGPVLRRARWIGVNSDMLRQLVHGYDVPLVRIIDSHPFVPVSRVALEPTTLRSGHAIVTIARLVQRKNISAIIEALVNVRAVFPDTTLVCIGDGPERPALEQRVAALGLRDAVRFYGNLDDERKWQLLKSSDLFALLPTVERHGSDIEGFGIAYCEASAAGLPVIGSDTGGIRDAVVDGQTGVLIDPLDQPRLVSEILRIFKDRELAASLGEQGRKRVLSEFTDRVRVRRIRQLLLGDQLPSVSVVIPAYQAASTIAATLESLVNQSFKAKEIIIVDDGSTDDLEGALAPFAASIRVFRQNNSGAPRARNFGFDQTTGEFVLFVDADIRLEKDALACMVRSLQAHPKIDYVYADFIFGWKRFHLHEYSAASLKKMNYIHTTSLLRRSAFPRFDESLKRFQDWDLWLTMAELGRCGMWIPKKLFTVQQRRQGLGMSTWLPSFVYRLPMIGRGRGSSIIAKYREAEGVIRKKHHT